MNNMIKSIKIYSIDEFDEKTIVEKRGEFSDFFSLGIITSLFAILRNSNGRYEIEIDGNELKEYELENIKYKNLDKKILRIIQHSIPEIYYGVWIKDFSDGYSLYRFDTLEYMKEFMEGYVSFFEDIKVDFRNYIYGPPFKNNFDISEYYQIDGYDISIPNLLEKIKNNVPFFPKQEEYKSILDDLSFF
jgi:hypothetical protein